MRVDEGSTEAELRLIGDDLLCFVMFCVAVLTILGSGSFYCCNFAFATDVNR